jgi:predicted PurR-regulated permease PerM
MDIDTDTEGATQLLDAVEEKEKIEPPRLQPIQRPWRATAIAIVGLFLLAITYTLYFAREILLPITLAWILNMLLKPVLNFLNRCHIPQAIGAGILLIGIIGLFAASILLVSEPASAWLSKAPQMIETATERVHEALRPAESISQAASKVENISVTSTPDEHTTKVEIKKPGLMNSVVSKTTSVIMVAGETLVLLYFLMASGELLMLKAIQALPRFKDKKRAVEIANEMQQQVSRYLGAVSIVNVIEGTIIGIGLALVGMPNPVLWGVLAALVNYVPYLGAMFCVACITVVSIVTFDSFSHAMLAPAIYVAVNVSDNFISPIFIGKRLVLNPLIVFLAVLFWGWIWGIVGVLIAVPLTMALKIFCDHFKTLAPIGELLAGEPEPARGSGGA